MAKLIGKLRLPSIPMQVWAASLLLPRCSAAHWREMAALNHLVEWNTRYVETQAVTFWPCLGVFNTVLECTLNKENSFYENRCIWTGQSNSAEQNRNAAEIPARPPGWELSVKTSGSYLLHKIQLIPVAPYSWMTCHQKLSFSSGMQEDCPFPFICTLGTHGVCSNLLWSLLLFFFLNSRTISELHSRAEANTAVQHSKLFSNFPQKLRKCICY